MASKHSPSPPSPRRCRPTSSLNPYMPPPSHRLHQASGLLERSCQIGFSSAPHLWRVGPPLLVALPPPPRRRRSSTSSGAKGRLHRTPLAPDLVATRARQKLKKVLAVAHSPSLAPCRASWRTPAVLREVACARRQLLQQMTAILAHARRSCGSRSLA
jgi:hypothetical protein